MCKSVNEIWSYRDNEFLEKPRKVGQGRSMSFIFELIQGHDRMHDWVHEIRTYRAKVGQR